MQFARAGTEVSSGDTLLLSYNGKMTVTFNDSDYIVLAHDTKAAITADEKSNVTVTVFHGKVYTNVVLLPTIGSFRTLTPKLTTSIRGTAYSVEVDSGETTINVLEGVVSVMDNDSLCPIDVKRGECAVVNPGQVPCKIKGRSIQEFRELVQWVGLSLVRLRKINEYRNDLSFMATLEALHLVDHPAPPVPSATQKAEVMAPKEGGKANVSVKTSLKTRPNPVALSKMHIPEDALRDPTYVRQVIEKNMFSFNQFYNQFLRKEKVFQGRVIVRFVIQPSGRVANPSIVTSTTGQAVFDSLLTIKILDLKFQPVKDKGDLAVVYPFYFTID